MGRAPFSASIDPSILGEAKGRAHKDRISLREFIEEAFRREIARRRKLDPEGPAEPMKKLRRGRKALP